MNSTLDDVLRQMLAAGMVPPDEPLSVGTGIHRYGRGGKPSWYTLHEFKMQNGRTVIVGAFGDWKLQISQKVEVDWKGVDAGERRALQEQMAAREDKERKKREAMAAAAAVRARGQWRRAFTIEQAAEQGITSPYLAAKGLTPESVRFANEDAKPDGTILIAAWRPGDSGADLVGLQKIAPDGEKRFNRGMPVAGSVGLIGRRARDGDSIFLVEGYATGRTVRMAQPTVPVYCAWNCGNLVAAAKAIRAAYPTSPVMVLADDDYRTDGNPGVTCAHHAARAIGNAWVVVPVFPDAATRGPKDTDFNDLMKVAGIEVVRAQVDPVAVMETPAPASAPAFADAIEEGSSGGREPSVGDGGAGAPPPQGPEGLQTPEGPSGEEAVPAWTVGLQRTDKGGIRPLLSNIVQILHAHPDWAGVLGFDSYAELIMKVAPAPWDKAEGADGADDDRAFVPTEWGEVDDFKLRHYLSRRWFDAKDRDLMQAVTLVARQNAYHPLMQRITATPWDGTHRLRTWLIDYLGACTSKAFQRLPVDEADKVRQYIELAGPKWLIGAVARVAIAARPGVSTGCQMDNMLVLEGEQGIMKSTALRILGGDWFTDERLDFGNKDSFLVLQGRWIIEMAELEGLNKADASATKQFITKREDLFRAPYGRKLEKKPRRCVFAGTANHDNYLKDDSGNRRFWPVKCERIEIEALKRDVDQLWAEAYHRFMAGEIWWVLPEEREIFAVEQEKRYDEDAWHELVAFYVSGRDEVTMGDLLGEAVKLDKPRWDKMAKMRIGSIMRRLGWEKARPRIDGTRVHVYVRPGREAHGVTDRSGDDDAAF